MFPIRVIAGDHGDTTIDLTHPFRPQDCLAICSHTVEDGDRLLGLSLEEAKKLRNALDQVINALEK